MAVSLLVAPAATGKTAYVVDLVREAARGLRSTPRVIVATSLQRRAFRRRLAASGGAIGVRVQTFGQLHADILDGAGEVYTPLSEPVQFRLIRSIIDSLHLTHYAPIEDKPGLVQAVRHVLGELKAARVLPETFANAVDEMGGEPRLTELAQVYLAYQERLASEGWTDRAGMAWLAVEALEVRAPTVGCDWPLIVVDGFDSFTPVQTALLREMSRRVGELVITLTGVASGTPGDRRKLAHRRFLQTRRRLEELLGTQATSLPGARCQLAVPLSHVERGLFNREAGQIAPGKAVSLVAAPDRATEVRAALRWLKASVLHDGMRPSEIGLLARELAPYRPYITQTAAEFGLPVRLVDGLPLAANPAIAAILDALSLVLPVSDQGSEPALPWRLVLETWRSPYFDWSLVADSEASQPAGILPQDSAALGEVARWGRVIGGLSQWKDALTSLIRVDHNGTYQDSRVPAQLPRGPAAGLLLGKLEWFVQRLTPPGGLRTYRAYASWLEDLIGPDPDLEPSLYPAAPDQASLQVLSRVREGRKDLAARDVAALRALKDILRGLVWSEEAAQTPPVTFRRFYDELTGAVEAASFRLPVDPKQDEILACNVIQARGVPLRAAAIMGLAEGEFPATIAEDPFLRDGDRERLRDEYGLSLEPSTESAETGYFYEAVTRPRERLLLTRPRLADAGALWQPSAFWEEILRLVELVPQDLTSDSVPAIHEAASWPEFMESLSLAPQPSAEWDWAEQSHRARVDAFLAGTEVLSIRTDRRPASPYDGSLSSLAQEYAVLFGPDRTWSPSRLESYQTCPFLFFVSNVLALEPREDPVAGLEAWQLGNVYHRIFEEVYLSVLDPTDSEELCAALPSVAAPILDDAPVQQGFRQTAWWAQTRTEIVETVLRSLVALADSLGEYAPVLHEAKFGLGGEPALVIRDGSDRLRLRGLIDRVDRTPDGRVRIIDYKTSGRYAFTNRAVAEGKKLQLPLYAMAARDALGLGEPVDGFYWHIYQADSSSFTLATFKGGPGAAIAAACSHAWSAVRAARSGIFVPQSPSGGCPSWCPAISFCWHARTRYGS